ncbi:MAG: alpha-N-acetylglucosaminidase C-terminal domain-containing protein, partial [Oscillospiraceae bacterium]|nr:alpha-N-acetylglucosaminidase C-terminal domain-containing protein [Oscillospiraceae bacterium]
LAPDCPAFTALGEAYHQQLKAILGETDVFFDVLEERCSALHLACASLSAQYTTNATPAYAIETPLSPPASQTSLRGDYAGAAAFVAAPGSRIHCGAAEPEANPLLLTLQLEALTRETPAALEPWLRRYASNRYGTDAPAAAVFAACGAVFAACGVVGAGFAIDSSFCRRPNTVAEPAAPWGGVAAPGDPSVWIEAARQLLAERKNAPEACLAALRYDLCDFLRQAMSERAGAFYEKAMEGYAARDARLFERSANDFLRLLENCDRLLCTVEAFSLPARLAKARGCAKLDAERNNFELAVLAQHSIYGGKGSRLRESHLLHGVDWREWGGLLGSLHYRRWELFFSLLAKRFKGKPLSLETKRKPLGRSEYETTRPLRQMAELERAWLRDYHPAEAEPGNTEETAEECLRVILH